LPTIEGLKDFANRFKKVFQVAEKLEQNIDLASAIGRNPQSLNALLRFGEESVDLLNARFPLGENLDEWLNLLSRVSENSSTEIFKRLKRSSDIRALVAARNGRQIVDPKSGLVFGQYTQGEFMRIDRINTIYKGSLIELDPNKTTTILGRLPQIDEVAKPGVLAEIVESGASPGGINRLSVPGWTQIEEKYAYLKQVNEELFWQTVSDEFWTLYNKPWLEDAIARGDNFRFVSDPTDDLVIYATIGTPPTLKRNAQGQIIPTIFYREKELLKEAGYIFLPDGTAVKLP
jgi:hypothetical protein